MATHLTQRPLAADLPQNPLDIFRTLQDHNGTFWLDSGSEKSAHARYHKGRQESKRPWGQRIRETVKHPKLEKEDSQTVREAQKAQARILNRFNFVVGKKTN